MFLRDSTKTEKWDDTTLFIFFKLQLKATLFLFMDDLQTS